MNFVKYPVIENSYRQEFVEKLIVEGKAEGDWIVAEKIHGSNFSFWCDLRTVRMAKRTCFIADDDDFYGIQKLKEELVEKVQNLYDLIMETLAKKIGCVAVFGELYGGTYPHPEVKADPQAKKVQKGVYYCPFNDFKVYDIKIDDSFVSFIDMQEYCSQVELNFVQVVSYGTFKECLEYPNDFPSLIYKEYGLPPIEGNICEGLVLRPNKSQFLHNHSRVILKSKNDKFKEKERKSKVRKEIIGLSEDGKEALDILLAYVTENRYDNVVSQIGEVTLQDFGKVLGAFAKDVFGDFFKEEESQAIFAYNNLEKAEQKMVNKTLNQHIANLVRNKLIKGE